MSIADDIRAAADRLWESGFQISATHLHAHADTIERVEKEMRTCGSSMVGEFRVKEWADALKGENDV